MTLFLVAPATIKLTQYSPQIGTVGHTAGEYWHGSTSKDGSKPEEGAPAGGAGNQKVMQQAQSTVAKEDKAKGRPQEAAQQPTTRTAATAIETTSSAPETSKETASSTAGKASQAYNDTTEAAKSAHRDVEDKAHKGVKDTIGSAQDASGTKAATKGASEG